MNLELETGVAHVWCATLPSELKPDSFYWRVLSVDEKERAGKLQQNKSQRVFVYTRSILRQLLARYLSILPEDILFSVTHLGKPFLAKELNLPSIEFNLSHSGDLILFAFTREYPIGVDVERIRPKVNYLDIAKRFFSAAEVRALNAFPEDEKITAFFHCWSRKEAVIKALGKGLSHHLSSFSVSIDRKEKNWQLSGISSPESWSLYTLDVNPEYAAALAVMGKISKIELKVNIL
jgi:4'-phosphopantetheinyl transferase